MKFLLMMLLMSAISMAAEPYKILIVADEESIARAQEFKTYLTSKVPPFNKMKPEDISINITAVDKAKLNCSDNLPKDPIQRAKANSALATCDLTTVAKMQSKSESHLAMVFTSQAEGGSGGSIPVATSKSTFPIHIMVHEMLHTYGCADEYEYESQEDLDRLCSQEQLDAKVNIAIFRDEPPYKSDGQARSIHSKDVPWMGEIKSFTPITQQTNLGSYKLESKLQTGKQSIGLFKGGHCGKKIPTWRPYENSLMRGHADGTVYPFYEKLIQKNIEEKIGRKLALEDCPIPGNVQPNVKVVDDLMRGLLK